MSEEKIDPSTIISSNTAFGSSAGKRQLSSHEEAPSSIASSAGQVHASAHEKIHFSGNRSALANDIAMPLTKTIRESLVPNNIEGSSPETKSLSPPITITLEPKKMVTKS